MEKSNRLPFEAILSIVIMLIMASMAFDGIFVQGLPMKALKYPLFCFAVVFVTSSIEIVRAVRKQKTMGVGEQAKPVHHNLRNYGITTAMLVAYVILMWIFGFIISSVMLTVAFTWYFKVNRLVVVNTAAAVVLIIIYYVFSNALYIFLPKGLLYKLIF